MPADWSVTPMVSTLTLNNKGEIEPSSSRSSLHRAPLQEGDDFDLTVYITSEERN